MPRSDRILPSAALAGIALAALFGGFAAKDFLRTRNLPTEVAVVTHSEDLGWSLACGRSSRNKHNLNWRSIDPPAGLPEVFEERDTCSDPDVNQRFTIVRVTDHHGNVRVYLNPPRTWSEVRGLALLGFAIGFPAVACWISLRRLVGWWLELRRRRAP